MTECTPRQPFVCCHRFELAGGMNNASRRSMPPPLPPWPCMVHVACRVVWCTLQWYVIPRRTGKNICPIRRVGFAGLKKFFFAALDLGFMWSKKKKIHIHINSHLHPIPPLVWPASLCTSLLFFFHFRLLFILLTHAKQHTHLLNPHFFCDTFSYFSVS